MANVQLGSKAIGSIVKLNVGGTARDFIVVHQGKPGEMYDESCNGTWLLMKDIYENRQWHNSNVNDYANSTIRAYLDSTFLARFDANIQAQIKKVKIPYRPGSGTSQTINSGANGLPCKVFLLSASEVGYTQSNVNQYIPDGEGAKLDYFTNGNGTSEKIAYLNGSAASWWMRSQYLSYDTNVWRCYSDGGAYNNGCTDTWGVRPALVLPSDLSVRDDGSVFVPIEPNTLGTKAVGSKVQLKLDGVKRNFIIVHQGLPSTLYDASCDGTWLLMEDCLETSKWHSSNVNDYANSTVHSYLNSTVLSKFDADIQAQIKQVKIPYRPGRGMSETVNSGENGLSTKIFLLSDREVGYRKANANNYVCDDGEKLAYFKDGNKVEEKIGKFNGSIVGWWLRSPCLSGNDYAWHVNSSGGISNHDCSYPYFYLRPALILPSNLLTSDDGTVNANTAPTTPGSITIPDSVQGGTSIQVSWSAASDAENNLEGYIVERSVDGGGTWVQVYQGNATSTTNMVPAGSETVMYRVKAYDTDGLYSTYRNSAQVSVFNNAAPSAPASITVPGEVLGGGSLTVTWGAASDPDNNLEGYELERQVDGGDWAQVYKGGNTSYTDNITRGWASVNYRVRAYDAYNATSGYTTGTAQPVNNNRAPTVTCDTASGSDLGTKSAGFDLAYSAGDEDGDAVSVTEAIDGAAQRTFTATPGETYTFQVTGETFMKVLNGDHALTITASDGKAAAVHKLTFTKSVTAASVTLAEPMEADAKITICVLSVAGDIPADAQYSVKVTNNANDEAPVWEDCTTEVKNGGNHVFENETAANGFAFNFKVEVERGASGTGGYISSVQGGFQ